jgi:L-lactate permease
MKAPLLIVLGAAPVASSGLAIMNNACKSSHHSWCAPMSGFRHHVKTGHR